MSEDKRTDEEMEDLVDGGNDGLEPETRSYLHKSRKRVQGIILGVTTVVGLGVATGIYVNYDENDEVLTVDSTSLVKESGSEVTTEESSVNVESAVAIDDKTAQSIQNYIKEKTGAKTIQLHTTINPAVIGGLVIKFGDNLLDTSIAAKLRNLKKELNIA